MTGREGGTPSGLRTVLNALRILSDREFLLAGRRHRVPVGRDGVPDLAAHLAAALYGGAYCAPPGSARGRRFPGSDLAPSVVRAFRGGDRWEDGWSLAARRPGGLLVAERDGVRRSLHPSDALGDSRGGLTVRRRRVSTLEAPGFITVFPEWEEPEEGGLVRFYWNLRVRGVPRFLRALAAGLDARLVPYGLKASRWSGMYGRRDACVLYLRRSRQEAVLPILAAVHREVRGLLDPGVPLFSRRMARGVGMAEDPGGAESFGTHRCALLAEAAVRSFRKQRRGAADRLGDVAKVFEEHGLSLDAPHLGPRSRASVEWPRGWAEGVRRGPPVRDPFLAAADRIAGRLCRDAIWSGERCAWIGPVPEPRGGSWNFILRATGPDLYRGSAGIALFLAEAFLRTGDALHRRTALGALAHAVSVAGKLPPPEREGFHSGEAGLVHALVRVGDRLGSADLAAEGRRRARVLVRARSGDGVDLLGGTAGTLLLLLHLHARDGGAGWLDAALRRGDRLLRRARRGGGAMDWPRREPGVQPGAPGLCGLTHGGSGIGWTLLELHAACGEERFRSAALAAFEGERAWFDAAEGNWPDLREVVGPLRPGRRRRAYTTVWCHGAPGIALVRARAWALLRDPVLRGEAEVALATTLRSLEEGEWSDLSLCHGAGGLAGVLAEAGRVLGNRSAVAAARRAAREWIHFHEDGRRPWPGGVPGGGEGPGLMTGLAGVGHLLLSLGDPGGVPSILLPVPGTRSTPAASRRRSPA